MSYTELKMLIDGEWTVGTSGKSEDVIDPATNEVLGQVPHASEADLDRALAAAQRGFEEWSNMLPFARQQIMEQAARNLEANKEDIARWCTMEMGKPLAESLVEMDFVIANTRWCGEEGRRAYGRIVPGRAADHRHVVLKEPVGPACAFAAWNFPGTNVIRKIAHALGAGCSMILKPSEETPATAIGIAKAFHDAGVPAGALQIVFGVPDHVSRQLIASPITRKLSFTGSVPVGKHLTRLAADTMMHVTMELGGHAPVMIFDDVDVADAAKQMAAFKFRNAGQVCISPTRFLVQKSIYGDFVDALTEEAKALKIGHGLDEGVQMGPLIAERRVDVMERLVADAKSHGGRVTTGGERVGNQGSFFAPTVIADVSDDAEIMNEEPFGPLAPVSPVDSVDEMITRANRLSVGLAAYAYVKDGHISERLSREVQAGMLGLNTSMISLAETPFGGIGDSGYGSEGGIEGIAAYQQTRMVIERR
ncbi:MAG: NAD-dependent succinate-semialdehyde dehydrogenase [Rhizobiaceae bacterium]|nr:NAD-dependent succinate-semialdehyde dehydrogenase [Rhizobiaceae bacterium]